MCAASQYGMVCAKLFRDHASCICQRPLDKPRKGGGDAGVPAYAWLGYEAGEPPFSRGQALPGYSPDFNADEAVWGWAREEATGNLCRGSKEAVEERVGKFLHGLTTRKDEINRSCRTVLQSRADSLMRDSRHSANAHPTLALV